jgi:catechol 2,3-dioxygenase-like lactoylglutathione lyase family enzyme
MASASDGRQGANDHTTSYYGASVRVGDCGSQRKPGRKQNFLMQCQPVPQTIWSRAVSQIYSHERGKNMSLVKPNRRDFLKGFAAGAFAASLPARASSKMKGTLINHISYQSADYLKTRDFYVENFGFQVSDQDNVQLYLWAGDALISAKHSPPGTAPRMDHYGFTVEPWDTSAIQAALRERGLPASISQNDPHDPDHKTVFTRDPNRYTVQLCAPDIEVKPAPVASRAPLKAVGVNHISNLCADYKKTCDFYVELLDLPVSHDDGKQAYLWFGDAFLWLRNNPTGNPMPVIDYFAWNVADWNADRVAAELKRLGLEARLDPGGKSVLTKDLNGYPLMLCSKNFQKRPMEGV